MNTTETKAVLKRLAPFVNKKSTLPVLRCIRVHRDEQGFVRFEVGDIEHCVSHPMVYSATAGLDSAVEFKMFEDIISHLDNGRFDLFSGEGKLVITAGETTATLPSQDWDMVDEPMEGQFRMAISTKLLSQIVDSVMPFIALEEERPALQQIELRVRYPELIVSAADGWKLGRIQTDHVEHFWGEDQDLLIPGTKLDKILALANGSKLNGLAMVRILDREKDSKVAPGGIVTFEFANGVRAHAQRPFCRFPDVETVIPKESEATFTFRVKDLQKALKAMQPIFKAQPKDGSKFKLIVSPDRVEARLAARESEGSTMIRQVRLVETPAASQEIVVGISPKHLGVILGAAKADEITFHTGPHRADPGGWLTSPLLFRANGNLDWLAVLMPMALDSTWTEL